ncbi:hypothetical protein CHUAL_009246 [Chamberlinius hualienensis]
MLQSALCYLLALLLYLIITGWYQHHNINCDFMHSQMGQIQKSLDAMFDKQTETLGVAFQNLLDKFEKLESQAAKNDKTFKKLDELYGRMKIVEGNVNKMQNELGDNQDRAVDINLKLVKMVACARAKNMENFSIRGRVLYWDRGSFEINKGREFAEIDNLEGLKKEMVFVKDVSDGVIVPSSDEGALDILKKSILQMDPSHVPDKLEKMDGASMIFFPL